MIQGPDTEPEALRALMRSVSMHMPVSVRLTNYTKSGAKFVHQLSCEPLRDPSGETRCFQATSLVLQAPGEAACEDEALIASVPAVSHNPMPPLWPLLGRAMWSDPTLGARGGGRLSPPLGAGGAPSALSPSRKGRSASPAASPAKRGAKGGGHAGSKRPYGRMVGEPVAYDEVLANFGAANEAGYRAPGVGGGVGGSDGLMGMRSADRHEMAQRVDELDDEHIFDWLQHEGGGDGEGGGMGADLAASMMSALGEPGAYEEGAMPLEVSDPMA